MKRKNLSGRLTIVLFPTFIGLYLIFSSYKNAYVFYVKNIKFSKTSGLVSNVRWSGHTSRGVSKLLYEIKYKVGEKDYVCTPFTGCGMISPKIKDAPDYFYTKMATKSPLDVYYDPKNPDTAYLYTGGLKESGSVILVGVSLLGLSALLAPLFFRRN